MQRDGLALVLNQHAERVQRYGDPGQRAAIRAAAPQARDLAYRRVRNA